MKRILLLEDNETSRKMIEKIINEIDEQIRVFSFTNATDAYEAVMMYSIDLFIIDIILDRKRNKQRLPHDQCERNRSDNNPHRAGWILL